MFKCKDCGNTDFNLVLQPEYEGKIQVQNNEHDEVEILVNGQVFTADLMFMNQFALCKECGSIKRWDYYFPNPSKGKKAELTSS